MAEVHASRPVAAAPASSHAAEETKAAVHSINPPKQKNVHKALGGGQLADVLLWRNMYLSGGILGGVFFAYILFEWSGYTLLSLIANVLLILVSALFIWSYAASLLNRNPPPLPKLELSEELVDSIAKELRTTLNQGLKLAHDVALGRDYILFFKVIVALYLISTVGAWFNLLTLVFLVVLIGFTVPKFYEQYHGEVDKYIKLAGDEARKYYAIVDEQLLSKIPRAGAKTKKVE
jgi:glucan phosphoethanolaminetransferase (alkaline phosphatase superfamily)